MKLHEMMATLDELPNGRDIGDDDATRFLRYSALHPHSIWAYPVAVAGFALALRLVHMYGSPDDLPALFGEASDV